MTELCCARFCWFGMYGSGLVELNADAYAEVWTACSDNTTNGELYTPAIRLSPRSGIGEYGAAGWTRRIHACESPRIGDAQYSSFEVVYRS